MIFPRLQRRWWTKRYTVVYGYKPKRRKQFWLESSAIAFYQGCKEAGIPAYLGIPARIYEKGDYYAG